jgi:uncharacterized protein (TIGR03435 family)
MRLSILVLLPFALAAQTPEFEVASIRPTAALISSSPGPLLICSGPKSEAENVQVVTSLSTLTAQAYTGQVDRMDLPPYARSPRFAVSVRIPPNTSRESCRAMLRNLLAERLHLVTNVEPGEITTYALKVAKSGLKLKPVKGPPPDLLASAGLNVVNGHMQWTFRSAPAASVNIAVSALVSMMALFKAVDRGEVKDETGLTGYYDGKLEYDAPTGSNTSEFSQEVLVRDALISQLGLTIEVRKTIGKVLTIRSSDSVPTEN